MKKAEFLYWLKGYFELRNTSNLLSKGQLAVIWEHLALVKANEGKIDGYLAWLEQALIIISRSGDRELAELTSQIEFNLLKEFKNVTRSTVMPDANPWVNPMPHGYEPLGDAYANQRIC